MLMNDVPSRNGHEGRATKTGLRPRKLKQQNRTIHCRQHIQGLGITFRQNNNNIQSAIQHYKNEKIFIEKCIKSTHNFTQDTQMQKT
jgi:hypothetical protein